MSNQIADMKGLGFAAVGIFFLALGLRYSPWFDPTVTSSRWGLVVSLFAAIALVVVGTVCLLRGERLHAVFFVFWSAFAFAGPGMVEAVWANSGAFAGIEGSRVWNGWILFGVALFNLFAGISALRGEEVETSGALAMVMVGVMFVANAVEHWGTAYWGEENFLDLVTAGAGLVVAAAAFWAAARGLLGEGQNARAFRETGEPRQDED